MLVAAAVVAAGLALALAGARAATIQTDLQVYSAGDTVTVTGSGFWSGEDVTFTTTDPLGNFVDIGDAYADGNGDVTYSFVLPDGPPGDYAVSAVGNDSGEEAFTTFDPPGAPTSLHYTDQRDAGGTSVALGWTGSSQTACYLIYRSTTGAPTAANPANACSMTLPSGNIIGRSTTTSFNDTTVTAGTRYFYGVTGIGATSNPGESPMSNVVDTNSETVSPGSADFGVTAVGVGVSKTFTFTNQSSITETFQNTSRAGTNPTDFTVSGTPAAGTTVAPGGTFTFTVTFSPASGAATARSASISINTRDNGSGSNNGHSIAVTGTVNSPPTCPAINQNTNEDTPSPVTLACTDPNGDPLTYSYTPPATGVVSGTAPSLSYTPPANFHGTATFTYTATDSHGAASAQATVTITVVPVNDAPTATDGSASTNEDTAKTIALSSLVSDVETPVASLTYNIVAIPLHGSLSIGTGGSVTYTPAANYNGTDSFTYNVTDNGDPAGCTTASTTCDPTHLTSPTKTITITVNPVNDPPVATDGSVTTNEDTAKAIDMTQFASDVETPAASLTYTIVAGPTHGTAAVGSGGVINYTPNANYNGADSFTYQVTDTGDGASPPLTSAVKTISITVAAVNDPPTASAASFLGTEDTPVTMDLTAFGSDVETAPSALTYTIASQPAHGTVTAGSPNGTFVYTPNANYNGADSFTYTVTDTGDGTSPPLTSSPATVSLTVIPVNDAPTATDGSASTNEDVPVTVDLSQFASDVETPASQLTYEIVAGPTHGGLSGSGANVTYTPNANFNGSDSFTYKVIDAGDPTGCTVASAVCDPTLLTSATKTITLTVNPVNDPPTAFDGNATTNEDTPTSINLTTLVSDVETAPLAMTYTIDTAPAHGSLSLSSTGVYTYTPNPNFNGADSFTYHVTDTGDGSSPPLSSATKTVTIAVMPVNDPPTALDGSATIDEDTPDTIDLTKLATDVETPSASLTYTIVTGPAHGSLSGTGGVLTYTPNANYNGSDSFTYSVTDTGDGASPPLTSAVHTISITIVPVNDQPTASDSTLTTNEDTSATIDLKPLVSDVETPAASMTYTIVAAPGHGTVASTGTTGVFTYTPAPNYNGTDSFTYQVTDTGDGPSAPLSSPVRTISVTVAPVNDAPTLGPLAPVTFDEGSSATVDLGAAWSDVETPAASATFSVVSAPAGLTATITGSTLHLSAADNLTGTVTVRGTDAGDGSSPPLSADATVQVTVNNVAPSGTLTGQTPIQEFTVGGGVPVVDGLNTARTGLGGNGQFSFQLANPVPAGDTLLISVGMTGPDDLQQVNGMTDSKGNTYSYVNGFAPATAAPLGSHSYDFSVMTTYVTHALSAGDTITGTTNSTGPTFTGFSIQVWQLSGVAQNGVEASVANDPHQTLDGVLGTMPVTTTDAPTLLVATIFTQHIVGITAGSGYTAGTQTDDTSWNKSLFMEYASESSPGTYSATFVTNPPETTLNVLVAFRGVAGGGGPAPGTSTVSFANATDPSSTDASSLRYAFDCNGGQLTNVSYATASTSSSVDCVFDNAGDYVVTARVLDKDGGISQLYSTTVHVDDVAPTATLSNNGPIDEGSAATISFTNQLDGSADIAAGLHYAFACDGSSLAEAVYADTTTNSSVSCPFDDGPSSHVVRARVIDQHDGYTEYTTTVAVRNVPPTATLLAPDTMFLGNSFSLTLDSPTDVSAADRAAGFTFAFDCGTGLVTSLGATTTCTPTTAGDLTVSGQLTDKDGGTSTYTHVVHVVIPAPTATLTAPDSVAEGSPIHVSLDNGQTVSGTALTYAFDCGSGYGAFSSTNATDCPTTDNGTVTVKGTVQDANGLKTEYTKQVTVTNVAPTVTAPANQASSEGSAVLLPLGSFSDPGVNDSPWNVVVNWGDGSSTAPFPVTTQGGLGSLTHTYDDNGTYSATVTVTDKDGGSGSASFTVTVANVAPTGTFVASSPVPEGSATALSFTGVTDPSTADTNAGITRTFSCDGVTYGATASCSFTDNGNYVVYGRLTDKDGGVSNYSANVQVTNVAPTATFTATSPINEGSATTISFTGPADPSAADTAAGFTYAIACDGVHFGAAVSGSVFTCAFNTPGTYTVAGQIGDKDGGTTTYTANVVVRNVAPVVTAAATQAGSEGSAALVSLGSFTDAGPNDGPWNVVVNWGDTTTSSFSTSSLGSLGNLTHTWPDNGAETVTVTVTDALGAAGSASFTVNVANVAPTATVTNDSPVGEGSPAHISFTNLFDPSTVDAASLTTQVACNGTTFSSTLSCTFDDQGSYPVTARVSDKDGGHTDYTTTVVVTNVAPTATLNATSPINEGSSTTISFTNIFDPSHADTAAGFTLAYSCNGTTFSTTVNTCSFDDNGSYTVYGKITDKDGGSTVVSAPVVVNNVAPTATLSATSPINEGSSTTISFSNIFDPSQADTTAGFAKTYSCDGTTWTTTPTCSFDDNGTFTVYGRIADKDGGTTQLSTSVTVNDVAPTATFAMTTPINEGSASTASFSNVFDPSHADTAAGFSYLVACDGTTFQAVTSCTFNDNGAYTVKGRITDKDGGSSTYTATVTVNNVPPTGTFSATTPVNEGSASALSFSNVTDASPVDRTSIVQTFSCDGVTYSSTPSCTFTSPGTKTVYGRLADKDGGTSNYQTSVLVNNVAPSVTSGGAQSANEGTSKSFTLGSFSDPGTSDSPWGVSVNWGDGTAATTFSQTTQGSLGTKAHAYANPGTYTVTVTVTDGPGAAGANTFVVTVNNVAPTVTAGAAQSANEGASTAFNLGSFSDPGANDSPWSVDVNWGDGTAHTTFQTSVQGALGTKNHTYATPGTYTATVKVTDNGGLFDSKTFTVTVGNVAPSATSTDTDQTVSEGASTSYNLGSFTDPGVNDGPWNVDVNWGDGSTHTTYSVPTTGSLGSQSHTYVAPGTYTVTVTVTDTRGGTMTQTFSVTVSNVAPTMTAAANQTASEGTQASIDLGSFTDPGSQDGPWSIDVNWGDGSPHTALSPAATGPLGAQNHTYGASGTYTVTVKATDKYGLFDSKTFTVTVNNVPPTASITGAPVNSPEGTPIVLGSTVVDPGFTDTFAYSWTVQKNGGAFASGTGTGITFTPDDNGTYVVTLTVTDRDGGTGTDVKTINVTNAAPTATLTNSGPINEGSSATISFSSPFDPSTADTAAGLRYAFSCTGPLTVPTWANASTSASTSCFFDDGTSDYVVYGLVIDKDGGYTSYTTTVHVNDVAPSATFAAPMSALEGNGWTLALNSGTDPSAADRATITYSFDCGNGVWSTPTSLSSSINCPTLANGTYTVRGTIADKDGSYTYTQQLTVVNVAPTATITDAPATSFEGTTITLHGSATDPGGAGDVTGYSWSVTKNGVPFGTAGSGLTYSFTPDDNGSYAVTFTATDHDGAPGSTTSTITVNDVAPTATITSPPTTGLEGSLITVSGTSTDISPVDVAAGLTQAWTVKLGTTTVATGSGASVAFTPGVTGTYAVTLTATDKDALAGSATASIQVTNVAPAPTITGAPGTSPEGTAISLGSTTGDPGAGIGDSFTYAWSVAKNGTHFGTDGSASTYSFTPDDNGSYVVTLKVMDADGASATTSQTITATNVAPTATVTNSITVNEGSPATIAFSNQADVSSADVAAGLRYVVACNGSLGAVTYAGASPSATGSCTFDDGPSDHTVATAIVDKDGGYTSYTTAVHVNNVAPTATFSASSPVNEGDSISLSLTAPSDPSGADTAAGFWYAFDCGTGSGYGAWSQTVTTASCGTTDNGTRAVKGEIKDKDGGITEYTGSVTIKNVPPSVTAGPNATANEGSSTSFSLGSFADPGPSDNPWNVDVNWGDGSAHTTSTAAAVGSLGSASHAYADNGTYTVTVTVTDKDGGVGSASFTVTVANVPPTGSWMSTANATAGNPLTLSWGAITDPSSADTAAGFRYAYDCSGNPITVTTYAAASTSASVTCTFPAAGTSTVNARVFDKDNGYSDYHTTVTVAANPPTIAFTSGSTSIPGNTASGTQFTYSWSITNGDATTTVAPDCGTGNAIVSGSLTYTTDSSGKRNGFSYKCVFVYTTPTTYTLHATATRGSVTGPTATQTVTITAAPPVITISTPFANAIYTRGTTVGLTGSFTDAGGSASGPYTITINWGDGSPNTVLTQAAPGSFSSPHIYNAVSSGITVTVTDKNGVSASKTQPIKVM